MKILYTKKYVNIPNQTPCVIIYHLVGDTYWFGKKVKPNMYRGKIFAKYYNDKSHNLSFFFNETSFNPQLRIFWINEKMMDFILPRLKNKEGVNRIMDCLIEDEKI